VSVLPAGSGDDGAGGGVDGLGDAGALGWTVALGTAEALGADALGEAGEDGALDGVLEVVPQAARASNMIRDSAIDKAFFIFRIPP